MRTNSWYGFDGQRTLIVEQFGFWLTESVYSTMRQFTARRVGGYPLRKLTDSPGFSFRCDPDQVTHN